MRIGTGSLPGGPAGLLALAPGAADPADEPPGWGAERAGVPWTFDAPPEPLISAVTMTATRTKAARAAARRRRVARRRASRRWRRAWESIYAADEAARPARPANIRQSLAEAQHASSVSRR